MSVLAVARKEVRQLSRDPRTLAVLVVLPALLLLFYGYVVTFDIRNLKLAVLDRDQTADSRRLVRALTSSEHFRLVGALRSERDIPGTFETGRASIVVVIPTGFSEALVHGGEAEIQALIDGSNASRAQTAQGYIELFATDQSVRLARGRGSLAEPAVAPRVRVLYNPELASERFLVSGLVAFILMISSTIGTALSVVKERETGTMEQLLVSPLTAGDVVLGKALPYGVIALAAAVLVMATARVAFGIEIAGSKPLLLAVTVLFILGAQGLGLLISSVTTSQQVAFQTATFATMLPTFLLSGFIFPIRSMPLAVQAVTFLVPARYFVAALRAVVLKGVGLAAIWPQVVALAVFSGLTLGLAMRRLQRVRL